MEFLLSQELAKAKDRESRKAKAKNSIRSFTKMVEYCETAKYIRWNSVTNFIVLNKI